LKTGGKPNLYGAEFDDAFKWYPYLFLDRSKPETHLKALSKIEAKDLAKDAPRELKKLIEHLKKAPT
jgi:hypothetical protein